jgi:ADYC domain
VICVVAACAVDPIESDVVGPPPIEVVERCPTFGCGNENSPNILGVDFYELNRLSSATNLVYNPDHPIAYVDFLDAVGNHYFLHVNNGKLTGVRTNHQQGSISGQALVGASIIVKYIPTGRLFAIKILKVSSVPYWAHGTTAQLEAYLLWYYEFDELLGLGKAISNLCKAPPVSLRNPDALTMSGSPRDTTDLAYHTLMFAGERINEHDRTDAVDIAGWFNFGCAGSALAKMYLTGHTVAAAADGFTTTADERTTILKMFSGDYCGTGIPFTVAGQPLWWTDDHATMWFFANTQTTLEARWGPNGAICLNIPRAAIPGTPAAAEFPAIYTDIQNTCTIPACADTTFALDGAHLVSVNPWASMP